MNDPRLTAYALGELDPEEARAVELELRDDPEARRYVESVRALGGDLRKSLAREGAAAPASGSKAESKFSSLLPYAGFAALAAVAIFLLRPVLTAKLRGQTEHAVTEQNTEESQATSTASATLRWELTEELQIPPNADTVIFQQGGVRIMSGNELVNGNYCAISNKQNMALVIDAKAKPLLASQSGGREEQAARHDDSHLQLNVNTEPSPVSELTRVWLKRTPEFDFYCDLADADDVVATANKELPPGAKLSR